MSDNITTFEWDATESGPEHYPMEIIKGDFIFKGEVERGLYIPSGGTLVDGWADPVSSHVTGDKYKPLPDRLVITFYSFAERQFYQGNFDLPYEKILTLFQKGVAMNQEHPVYSRIMVGIAPGGAVAVWVIGSGDRHEVFFGQAEKINLDPSSAFSLPFKSKEQADAYITKQLVNVLDPEELEDLKNNGVPFGLWDRYRLLYNWLPTLSDNKKFNYVSFEAVNGERRRNWNYKNETSIPIPVPKKMSFETVINNTETIYKLEFDEFEIMEVFEKLSANNQKVYLEFDPYLPRTAIKVRLYNEKESIALKKFKSKDW